MKIGLVGATSQEASLPFNAEDAINCYAVMDKTGKEVAALYGTPGLYTFSTLGNPEIRAEFFSSNGRAFAVCGSQFFEIDAAGNSTLRGSLLQSSGIVYIEENTVQIGLCDGVNIYMMDYATNTFAQVIGALVYCGNGDFASGSGWTTGANWSIGAGVATAATATSDLTRTAAFPFVAGQSYTTTYTIPTFTSGTVTIKIGGTAGTARSAAGTYTETIVAGATQDITFTGAAYVGTLDNVVVKDQSFGLPASCGSLTFIDSFFIVNDNGSGRFFKSAPNNGKSWNALDFATAESSPDNLRRPIQIGGNLFLMGDFTGEIWTNTGASAFPFQKVAGGKMNTGIYAPASALEVDNTLLWVGRDKFGFGIVYRANGFTPKRISTTPVERIIKAATDGANIRSYSYENDGHLFYVLTGGGLAVTLVYDVTTDMWHKRAYLNPINGGFEQHLGACYMNAFGKHLVGDRNTGRIYVMDEATYDDNGDPLAMERIFTHISDEEQRIRYNNLVIGAESGVGTQTGQGYDPVIELQLSYDGARTWSDIFSEPIGKAGEYLNKCEFRQIGVAAMLTIKIRMTDPVPRRITGSYLS